MNKAVLLRPAPAAGLSSLQYIAIFTGIFYVIVFLAAAIAPVREYTDYPEYINLTLGAMGRAHQPFAGRIFAPLLARLIMASTGVKPAIALGAACLAGWVVAPLLAGTYLLRRNVPIEWAAVVASIPYPALAVRFLLVPDAWAICFVLAIFLALESRRPLLAWASAAGLAFARTSSLLAVALRAAAAPGLVRPLAGAGVFVAFALAVGLKAMLFHADAGNQHGMNGVLYLIAKTPVNALSNYLGMHLYTNTFPYCSVPLAKYELGEVRALGNIHTIGLCPLKGRPVITSLLCYVFIFGVFPFLMARRVLAERPFARALHAPHWRDMAVFLAAFLLCPAFGLTITRLFVEAYPLLVVAIVALVGREALTRPRAITFLAYNLVGFAVLLAVAPD